MLRKLLSAALVTLAAAAPAALAGEAAQDRHSYVIALGDVDASNPSDVDRVMEAFKEAGRKACKATGSRLSNQRCVKQFVTDAIASVQRDDLQIALMNGDASGGGVPQAASAPDRP